ncbi:hypothetical protein, partial [Bradyrhizobium sp.]|uniref:hypothetical protein n=1 Tax=Bradyrhizobium sp. TaxID=376 RepID=UPI0025C40428
MVFVVIKPHLISTYQILSAFAGEMELATCPIRRRLCFKRGIWQSKASMRTLPPVLGNLNIIHLPRPD